ncbi:MAG: lysyl oxidase family protein, partial [Myxococcota bacterium]
PFWDDLNPASGGDVYVYAAPPTCEADCNGVVGGFAYYNEEPGCNTCVTGIETGPSIDCNGVCGGRAEIDGCGICAGGDTGIEPQQLDCEGVCGGSAYIDDCRVCVGGNTGLEPTDPAECPTGVDLTIDAQYLEDTVYIDYINVAENDCLIQERCVAGSGQRKLIRFGTRIANIGNEDLILGSPSDGGEYWHYDECHSHYHYEAYAAYQLYDLNADTLLDIGSKNGFCVIDIGVYDPNLVQTSDGRCRGYSCSNQGITAGCQDTYSASLQCQWIDVTGLPDGDYDVIVITNPAGEIPELTLDNNSGTVRVRMEGDTLTVLDRPGEDGP